MVHLLTTEEAAAVLGTTRQSVYQLIHSGALRAKRLGRGWRIHPEWLDQFIHSDASVPHMPPDDRQRLRAHNHLN